ncbi:MAG: 30S ribosomal protein S20 [Pseudobdellovibrionaceae bacterium]
MANHKSAAKRARGSLRKNEVNTRRKNTTRTHEKSLLKAIAEKKIKEIPALLGNYVSQMAKAAQKGVFKSETASRKISRISARVHQALSAK